MVRRSGRRVRRGVGPLLGPPSAGSLAVVVALLVGLEGPIWAADTMEPYARGLSDLEFYVGYDGLGRPSEGQLFLADFVVGVGLTSRLSAYFGTTLQGSRQKRAGEAAFTMGLFGTVLDTAHVDLDLMASFGVGGPDLTGFQFAPGFELNLDAAPDLSACGVYVRGVAVLAVDANGEGATGSFVHHLVLTFGSYVTFARDHQLLLEFDTAYHPVTLPAEDAFEIGGLALGYNVHVRGWLELITQLYVDLPQDGEAPSVGLQAGAIFTFDRPGGGAARVPNAGCGCQGGHGARH